MERLLQYTFCGNHLHIAEAEYHQRQHSLDEQESKQTRMLTAKWLYTSKVNVEYMTLLGIKLEVLNWMSNNERIEDNYHLRYTKNER